MQRVQREATQAHHAQLDSILYRQAEQRQQMQAIISGHQERITQRIKVKKSFKTAAAGSKIFRLWSKNCLPLTFRLY